MQRNYKTLFNLSIVHEFYTTGKGNDFIFLPTSQTAKDMSRFKCIARPNREVSGQPEAHGLQVLYVEQNSSELIPITAATSPSMVFGMQLHNSRFWNFTAEVTALDKGQVFYYTSIGANTAPSNISLSGLPVLLRRKTFAFNYSLAGGYPKTLTIEVADETGSAVTGYPKERTIEEGDFEFLIDLNGVDDGRYDIKIWDGPKAGLPDEVEQYYISDELTMAGVFGILDLRLVNNTDFSDKTFEINFLSREEVWKYFLVFKDAPVGNVTITHSSLTFNPVPNLNVLGREADKQTADSIGNRSPAPAQITLFESDVPVKFKETVEKNIKLKVGNTEKIKHMPSPSLDSPKAEAYIFI